MYIKYFLSARDYLSQQGLNPRVVMGNPVSKDDLDAADASMGVAMPPELRQFYLELGDAFAFIPDDRRESKLYGWDYLRLRDHVIVNEDFAQRVDYDAAYEMTENPQVDATRLNQETNRRKSWMPFYGFVGSGELLCLDLATSPPPVCFHEPLHWVSRTRCWDFTLASSFTEFVEKWSQYHFLTPLGDWLNFCRGLEGKFDWAAEHFPKIAEHTR